MANLDSLCTNLLMNKCTLFSLFFFFLNLSSFAYIEFSDRDSVQSAIGLHETLFRGRVLKVRMLRIKTYLSDSNV